MIRWRAAVAFLLVAMVGIPLAMPFVDLLSSLRGWHVWIEYGRLLALARNTLFLTAGVLILVVPSGVVGAVLLYRTDLPGRRFLRWLILLTLFVPLPLFASGWQAALGSGGWLPITGWGTTFATGLGSSSPRPLWAPWLHGLESAIWIHAVAGLPWMILLTGQGLCWVERDLEEDALTVAGPWRVLLNVTLSRSMAAIAAGAVWVALQTSTEITVTDMLQVRTFAEEVYTQMAAPEPDSSAPDAAAVVARAVAVGIPAILLSILLVLLVTRRWERSLPPLTTWTTTPLVYHLGWARWPCLIAAVGLVLLLFGTPTVSLAWKAGLAGSPEAWSAQVVWFHLQSAFRTRGTMVAESLLLAGAAGAAIATLALVVCWTALGTRRFQTSVLLVMATAWAIPGPVMGLGLKEAIAQLIDLDPTGMAADVLYFGPSPLPMLWAYLVRFLPCAVAIIWPVVRLIPRELRDALRLDGGDGFQELRWIVWPLSAAASLRAGLAVAVLSLGELSGSKLVETAGTQVFAHEVFNQMHYGVTNHLAALCLILLAAIILVSALFAVARWGLMAAQSRRWRVLDGGRDV